MTIGLVGRKCGMTRVFTDAGVTVPVTVVEALPNRISQVKDAKADGYRAVQVTIGSRKASRVTKALAGHFAKANVAAGNASQEFRLSEGEGDGLAAGGELKVDMFKAGIVEPAKVTRSALQNAASIAALFLTTEAIVADKPDSADAKQSTPSMGGMGF